MDNKALSIAAGTTIAAAPAEIFDLLANLDCHRDLTDQGMRILELQGPPGRRTGGLVELQGPVGLTRLARTRVGGAEPHSRLWGTAETTDGARASLEWRVRPHGDFTLVEVRVDMRARKWSDRILLLLGGRAWLRARLRAALYRLQQIW
jgi:hypothetical protein